MLLSPESERLRSQAVAVGYHYNKSFSGWEIFLAALKNDFAARVTGAAIGNPGVNAVDRHVSAEKEIRSADRRLVFAYDDRCDHRAEIHVFKYEFVAAAVCEHADLTRIVYVCAVLGDQRLVINNLASERVEGNQTAAVSRDKA